MHSKSEDITLGTAAFLGLGIIGAVHLLRLYVRARRSPLHKIPTIGYSGVLTSYITAIQYFYKADVLIQEGYEKYPEGVFKISTLARWLVLVSNTKMSEDVRRAKDSQLCNVKGNAEILQLDAIIGPQLNSDLYHVDVVRRQVTQNIGACFPDVVDETTAAFTELLPDNHGNDWISVVAFDVILKAVIRTSNRVFVGLPLCRDPDYINLQERATVDVVVASRILTLFPSILQPYVARLTKAPGQFQRNLRHLEPLINDRLAKIDKLGPDYDGKPNDLISWCLEYAPEKDRRKEAFDLSTRVLSVNFASIHTTSMTLTQILYDVAAYPEYLPAIREEIQNVIAENGITKDSMGKLRKLDSFMKESMRLWSIGAWLMPRKVINGGFTFSNGVFVPEGTTIGVIVQAMHEDDSIYPEGKKFDGLRFYNLSGGDPYDNKHLMSALSADFIVFGHGRHACPGRFFAVAELKAMLVYLITNYDIKLATGKRPSNWPFEHNLVLDMKAKLMFKKRQ